MSTQQQPALDVQNVGKRYPGTVAVDGVDLQVMAGSSIM
jgi:ABC-type sugar transport system ATPase subunit